MLTFVASLLYSLSLTDGFASKLGERIGNVLKAIFLVPKPDAKRVITFHNDNDFISRSHHMYAKSGMDKVALSEVRPRFEMSGYQLRLGTLEMKEAEMEYVLRPYQNTGKKRKVL